MYTQAACGAPSGTTQLPSGLVTAAQSAGQSAADQNASPVAAVAQIVQTLQQKFPQISHNAIWYGVRVGMQAAAQRQQDRQVARANQAWWRLMQRQPSDFAGAPVQPADIQQPTAAVVQNQIHPMARAASDAAVIEAQRSGPMCNPDFSDAPDVVPIDGGFAYQIPAQKLTTNPSQLQGITANAAPLPFQRVR